MLAYGWESTIFAVRNYLTIAPKKSHDYQVYRIRCIKGELDEYAAAMNYVRLVLHFKKRQRLQFFFFYSYPS